MGSRTFFECADFWVLRILSTAVFECCGFEAVVSDHVVFEYFGFLVKQKQITIRYVQLIYEPDII